jgi:hypothetical protein
MNRPHVATVAMASRTTMIPLAAPHLSARRLPSRPKLYLDQALLPRDGAMMPGFIARRISFGCTREPPRSRAPPWWKDSACPSWRPWSAARLSPVPGRAPCRRSPAAQEDRSDSQFGESGNASTRERRRDTAMSRPTAESASPPELAVIIPVLNERENLEILLPAAREEIAQLGISAEIAIVDGGSHDGTRETAQQRGARVVPQRERGYGGALLAGFAATAVPYIATMDANLSHRLVFLQDLWRKRDDAEVLIASRYIAGGRAYVGRVQPLLSHILNCTYRRALSLRDLSAGIGRTAGPIPGCRR